MIILLLLLHIFQPPLPSDTGGSLLLRIDNIEQPGGMVWVGIYDSQSSFLNQEKAVLVQGEKIERAGKTMLRLREIPYGTYAAALFYDENNNGVMEQNWIGIPLEPYGFSVPFSPKWRAPRFNEVKFDFLRDGQLLETELMRW